MSFRAPNNSLGQHKLKLENLDNYSTYSFNLEKISSSGTPMVRNHSNSHLSNTPSGLYVREQLSQFQNKNGQKFKRINDFGTSFGSSPAYFQSAITPQHQNYMSTTATNSNQNSDAKKPFFKSSNLMQRSISSASKIITVNPVQQPKGAPKKINMVTENDFQSSKKSQRKSKQNMSPSESQQESFFTKEQQQKLKKLKIMYKNLQEQQEAEDVQANRLQEELHQQVSGDKKVFYGPIDAVQQFENKLQNGEMVPVYSASPTLNKRIMQLHTDFVPDVIMNPQQQLQQIHNQQYTPYQQIKKNRIQNAKLYRNVVGSMNKQIKPVSKEMEEVKQKLNGKHNEHIKKILVKLSIINIDKNQKLKDNANNEIVFDKMMQEICKNREKITKHALAREKVKEKLNDEYLKINYVNIPKYDHSVKKDFFTMNSAAIHQYRKHPDDLIDLLKSYYEGQEHLIEALKDEDGENLFDVRRFSESEFDPFFTNPYLKEIMSKHLIFRKGQKLDFFGKKEIKKRTIQDILKRFNYPSQCSSSFDSETSFYYVPSSQQQID